MTGQRGKLFLDCAVIVKYFKESVLSNESTSSLLNWLSDGVVRPAAFTTETVVRTH